MTILIKDTSSKEEIQEKLKIFVSNKKKSVIKKFFGISKTDDDALAFQKKVRNEWN